MWKMISSTGVLPVSQFKSLSNHGRDARATIEALCLLGFRGDILTGSKLERKPMNRCLLACMFAVTIACAFCAGAETITAATYNVEVFHEHFAATTHPTGDRELTRRLRADADKDCWMIAQVILDPKF